MREYVHLPTWDLLIKEIHAMCVSKLCRVVEVILNCFICEGDVVLCLMHLTV